MKKDDLLKSCRYYKGEERCPAEFERSIKNTLWAIESDWVAECLLGEVTTVLDEAYSDYIRAGLGLFQMADDTPLSLKAFIFYRLRDSYVDAESFKTLYIENYQ